MQWTRDEQNEWFYYVFQHKYNRVEQAAEEVREKQGEVSEDSSSKIGGVQSEYNNPDDDATMEFELSIATFARPDSLYNVDRWLKLLGELAGENHSSKFDNLQTRLQQIREGEEELVINQKNITDYKAYEMMALKVIFAGDLDANVYEQYLLKPDQTRQLLWKKYHTYCTRLWDFLLEVHSYRSEHRIEPKPVNRKNICIYCKQTDGDFIHAEHTIPESLGNEYDFLPRGFVCKACMLKLNDLEEGISQMLPFSSVRVIASIGNKKGRLPSFKSGPLHIQKKSPNKVAFKSLGKKGEFEERPVLGGHLISYKTTAPSGHFNAHKVARMLYKSSTWRDGFEEGTCHSARSQVRCHKTVHNRREEISKQDDLIQERSPIVRYKNRMARVGGRPHSEVCYLGLHIHHNTWRET